MEYLPGYSIVNAIHEGKNVTICRGFKLSDKQPVIFKIQKTDYPSASDIECFRREFALGGSMESEHVIRYLALEKCGHHLVMFLEDFSGTNLEEQIPENGYNVDEFLKITLQLAAGLKAIHQANIIHRDIKPRNILFDSDSGKLKIIDFSIACYSQGHFQDPAAANQIQGTLAYMSPEQTGCISRVPDQRSDFYSLGVVFYRLLTGRLPFACSEPQEFIHAHIARVPVAPVQLKPELPGMLSELVMKLLAKNAEDRYQGAAGLAADLQRCRKEMEEKGSIDRFPLGRHDVAEKFQFPQKLYGREKEWQVLQAAFSETCSGTSRVVLIAGGAGVGKSVLAREILAAVSGKNGYFAAGKFDLLNHDAAYEAVAQAFRGLLGQFLNEGEAQLQAWKDLLRRTLPHQGRLLQELIPELELFLEPQIMPVVSGLEARSLMRMGFQDLIAAVAQKDRPLVLFLDDLQWIDAASLDLFHYLAMNTRLGSFLLIGAYRDNEVAAAHPFKKVLEKIGHAESPPIVLQLAPLPAHVISQLFADIFSHAVESMAPLTATCAEKTGGNPFFIKVFLQSLLERKLMLFENGKWAWQLEKIESLPVMENVVDLLAEKMRRLPTADIRLLETAACLGNVFSIEELERIGSGSTKYPATAKKNAVDLQPLLNSGLIFKSGDRIHFSHDRIQEAAYSLIPSDERPGRHLHIGRRLLAQLPEKDKDDYLFRITDHVNRGCDLIRDAIEKMELMRLNLAAGKKAKAAAAFESAWTYLETCRALLPEGAWEKEYPLAFEIFRELSDVEFHVGRFEDSAKTAETLVARCRTDLEKAEVLSVRTLTLLTSAKLEEAIRECLKALRILHVRVPSSPGFFFMLREKFIIDRRMRKKRIEDLSELPESQGQEDELVAKLFYLLSVPSFYTGKRFLYALSILKMVSHSLKRGNSIYSPYGYVSYGAILEIVFSQWAKAYEFGRMAIRLSERKREAWWSHGYSLFYYALLIQPWNEHWKNLKFNFQEAIEDTIRAGHFMNFIWGIVYNTLWDPEIDIPTRIQVDEANLKLFESTGNIPGIDRGYVVLRLFLSLRGQTRTRRSLDDDRFDSQAYLERCRKSVFKTGEVELFLPWMQANFFFEDYQEAQKHYRQVKKQSSLITGLPYHFEFHFFGFLVLAAVQPELRGWQRMKNRLDMGRHFRRMERWAGHCPANFLPFKLLMEAERARLAADCGQAASFYDQAIAAIHEYGFIRYEALFNEQAAKFYLGIKARKAALPYLKEANYLYGRWGATEKVKQLQEKYGTLLSSAKVATAMAAPQPAWTSTTSIDAIDFDAIIRASQAIAKEIDTESLQKRMMKIVMENAGAEKGLLVLNIDGSPQAVIAAQSDPQLVTERIGKPLESYRPLPLTVVRAVLRTGQPVFWQPGEAENVFNADPYLREQRPQAAACLPLRHQDAILGALYLENARTAGAFPPGRVRILEILLTQAAISLANASLFAEQVRLKEEARQAQENFLQAAKMVSLGTLASGVAHEINNPNNTIMLNSAAIEELWQGVQPLLDLASEQHGDLTIKNIPLAELREKVPRLFAGITGAAERIKNLSRELRDFARRDPMDLSQDLDINQVAQSAVSLLGHLIGRCTDHFTIDYGSDLPLVRGNFQKMEQVIVNLLQNALESLPDRNKKISLATDFISQTGIVEVVVSDQGRGIAPENLERITDPFFTTRRDEGGSGLGLSIAASIVKDHQGTLEFISEPGLGTRARVSLRPLVAAGEQ